MFGPEMAFYSKTILQSLVTQWTGFILGLDSLNDVLHFVFEQTPGKHLHQSQIIFHIGGHEPF